MLLINITLQIAQIGKHSVRRAAPLAAAGSTLISTPSGQVPPLISQHIASLVSLLAHVPRLVAVFLTLGAEGAMIASQYDLQVDAREHGVRKRMRV